MILVDVSVHISSDQTGILPSVSIRGNRSVMVLYKYYTNAILTYPLKNITTKEFLRTQTRIIQYLLDRGLKPKALHNNKTSSPRSSNFFSKANSVNCQIFQPHDHCMNQSKNAIDTWKCQFLGGNSGMEPSFPIHLWYRLLPKATQTLNLLRQSLINPRLLVEAHIKGTFDYN